MEEKERVEAEERRKKNPLEKIAEMTVEMAKLVLVVQALSGIKKDGKEQGFAEISDEKLSNIIGIDKSRIGGKNGLIFEAVQKGYICAANAKTNEPLLDKDGKEIATLRFGNQGTLTIEGGDLFMQGMKIDRNLRFYASDIWCRGAFGAAERTVMVVKGSKADC